MSNEFILKVVRLFLGMMTFLCCLNLVGMLTREAHQYVWILASYVLFALLLRNIWLTLFVWLTVFLYSFYKFNTGGIYLNNIFAGCVFFYLTKLAFEKKHIDWFINMVLWVLVINLFYGIIQILNRDFIYGFSESSWFFGASFNSPFGFMSNTGIAASFIAMCIPLVASRKGTLATCTALALFPMFYILHASAPLIAASGAFLFVLFFKYSRKVFIITTVLFALLGGGFFLSKCDTIGTERFTQWQLALVDAAKHPIIGWGLDSFRTMNKEKNYVYCLSKRYDAEKKVMDFAVWDNPHNLLISLQYEFGFLAIFLLGGYFRQCILWFRQSDRNRNIVAIAGFIISFMLVSMGQFPAFLARIMVIAVPLFALYEVSTRN